MGVINAGCVLVTYILSTCLLLLLEHMLETWIECFYATQFMHCQLLLSYFFLLLLLFVCRSFFDFLFIKCMFINVFLLTSIDTWHFQLTYYWYIFVFSDWMKNLVLKFAFFCTLYITFFLNCIIND